MVWIESMISNAARCSPASARMASSELSLSNPGARHQTQPLARIAVCCTDSSPLA
jgi:hypothetical protein